VTVIDVAEPDFAQQVLERSRELPVVVDFWAEWCAPCRQLGPVLERAAQAREGEVLLAKVDTDRAQGLARDFDIRGIPAVKAFRDGGVVSEFVGVQPAAAVESFFDALVPSEADALTGAGDEQSLRRALELEPGRPDAVLALARLLLERGDREQALAVAEGAPGSFQADGLGARIRLEQAGAAPAPALRALDDGDTREGLELLLEALAGADGSREDLRRLIVGELDALGPEHPLAREIRRRLAATIY
jgi:putative thioredoxin